MPVRFNDGRDDGSAVFVTSRNCELVVGLPWLTAVALFERHGGKTLVIGPRRRLIPVDELRRAIALEHAVHTPARPRDAQAEAEAILAELGLERAQ